jgi:polyhydroxyalkanoate synthesis regulator phasin
MPTQLAPVLTNAPFVDPRGYLTRVASGWLEASYIRQGGESAASNTELSGATLANAGHIHQVEDDLGTTSANLAALEAEVTALQEAVLTLSQALEVLTGRVDTLETQVETLEETVADQETRLSALEAWRVAVVAGLPAAVTVAGLPTLTDAPATADALRDNLTSAWEGVIETNDTGLQTAINAVRTALAA